MKFSQNAELLSHVPLPWNYISKSILIVDPNHSKVRVFGDDIGPFGATLGPDTVMVG